MSQIRLAAQGEGRQNLFRNICPEAQVTVRDAAPGDDPYLAHVVGAFVFLALSAFMRPSKYDNLHLVMIQSSHSSMIACTSAKEC